MLRQPTSVLLDSVRAISAQLVVVGHALGFAFLPNRYEYVGQSGIVLQAVGVILFFALSGFVIAYTAIQKIDRGRYGLTNFLVDRTARIYSGLLPSIVLILILDCLFGMYAPDAFVRYAAFFNGGTFLANLLQFQDYPPLFGVMLSPVIATTFGTGIPLWSLAVEWWMYVFFGAVFLAWPLSFQGKAIAAGLLVLALPVVWENAVGGRGGGLSIVWLVAALLALAFDRIASVFRRKTAAWGLLALVTLIALDKTPIQLTGGYDLRLSVILLLTLFFGLMAAQATVWRVPDGVQSFARRLAGYSFTLYLTHYSIVVFIKFVVGLEGRALLLTSVIAANVVAAVLASFTGGRRFWVYQHSDGLANAKRHGRTI